MNNDRRKRIEAISANLSELRDAIETIRDEEQEAFDNMPESLQCSERGELSESAISALDNAASEIENIESYLSEATE